MKNKLFNINALDLMDKMIENKVKVDHIITDPPFNISKDNNFATMGRQSLDFGEWDKNFDQESWIIKASKVIKDGGSIVIFNGWKNMGDIAKTLENNGFLVKDILRWIKSNPMPRNRDRRYITDYEFAIWATKGKDWTFNRIDENYQRPEFKYPAPGNSVRIHPNQKSYELIKEILMIHTNVGDTIFDPFSGSGTISKVCIENGRNFIASEMNKEFYEKSIKYISEKFVK